jgi:hypothetical protein
MTDFDFEQFQQAIFKKVFSDVYEKAPTREEVFGVDQISETVKVVQAVEQLRGRGRPKGTFKRKRQENQFDCKTESKENDDEYQLPKKIKEVKHDEYQLPKKIKAVKPIKQELHQPSQPLKENDQNVRRSLRTMIKNKRGSVEAEVKPEKKKICDINTQDDFLYFLGLERVIEQ